MTRLHLSIGDMGLVSQIDLIRDAGKIPAQPGCPASESVRDGAAFASLQGQLDRLTDIHANAAVDWQMVVDTSISILTKEGKDLAVGTWLVAGLLETRDLNGLVDGVHVLRDLATEQWETMSPPASRMRGRRNQMQWLLDHLNERLRARRDAETPRALTIDAHMQLLADWDALDTFWSAHDDEPPALFGMRTTLRGLPVEEPPVQSEPTVNEMPSSPAVQPSDGDLPASAGASSRPTRASAAPASAPRFQAVAGADPEAAADDALTALHPFIEWCLHEHAFVPVLFRLNRACAWSALEQPPPDMGGTTRLMPPPFQTLNSFEQIGASGEAQSVVHFSESNLITHRFWLDLNRASHAALSRMGASDAAAAVGFETARLVARLPGLLSLKFSDGQPFADATTRVWIESFIGSGAATSASAVDDLHELISTADADAAGGRLDEGLDRLQTAAQQSDGLRTRFRLRLAQCALLHRFDDRVDLRPMLQSLVTDVETYKLQYWEPELAQRCLALAATIQQRWSTDDSTSYQTLMSRLASLDCRAAWKISQSNVTT